MNGIPILATQPWVERLGLTLLHFLWQGAIIVTIYAAARRLGARTLGPAGRYSLACSALAAMAIVPIVTWMVLSGPVQETAAVTFTAPLSAPRAQSVPPVSLLLPSDVYAVLPEQFL